MKNNISTMGILFLFYTFSAALFLAALQGNIAITFIALIFFSQQLYVCIHMARNNYIYTATMNFFHLATAIVFVWIFYKIDFVEANEYHNYSVFTFSNMKYGIQLLILCLLISSIIYVILLYRWPPKENYTFKYLFFATCGSARHWRPGILFSHLLFVVVITLIFFISNPSVLDIPYPYQRAAQWVPGRLSEAMVFWAAAVLCLAYINASIIEQHLTFFKNAARISFIIVSILILFLNGNRGLFCGVWLLFGFCEIYLARQRSGGSYGWGVLFLLLAYLGYVSWDVIRSQGASAPTMYLLERAFLAATWSLNTDGAQNVGYALRLNRIPTFSHMIFHLLYAIDLVERGYSLEGATFLNLFPQLLPRFLEPIVGERPLNDNWLLSEYFAHGGGFLAVANAYWNGGILVLAMFMASISAIFGAMDRCNMNVETGTIYRAAYWIWLPVMAIQLGYGIQGLVRVIEYLCLAFIMDRLWRYYRRRDVRGGENQPIEG
ncbi:membrane hypothetical protein [uncultured Defluviicoccus sp.]|uniref:O-antigen polysaccharide polymerase Wzy n=1 Tax=metagenome TaxID=256318 RepID=A0A380TM33_9ZZZZ|nr:membrane hypothetical protein [uncultured Defluviicoccus sp.]